MSRITIERLAEINQKHQEWNSKNIVSGSGRPFSISGFGGGGNSKDKKPKQQEQPKKLTVKKKREKLNIVFNPHAIAVSYLDSHPEKRESKREHYEQARLFLHFFTDQSVYPYLTACPMGGLRTNGVAGQLLAEGVKKGYPDVILDLPKGPYHGLRIEMKRPALHGRAAGVVSPDQCIMLNRLHNNGYAAQLCYCAEEAIAVINTYMSLTGSEAMPERPQNDVWLKTAA